MSAEPLLTIKEQMDQILTLVADKCYEFDNYFQFDEDPRPVIPKCETSKKPPKLGPNAGKKSAALLMGGYHTNGMGYVIPNARECPICGAVRYDVVKLDDVVTCVHCNSAFIW